MPELQVGGLQKQTGGKGGVPSVQVSSGGQKPPHTPPPAVSAVEHGVPPTGMQPQSKPPDTQTSPAGHAPSHIALLRPPHGCVPATH